jgi:hypothetical protein
MAAGDRNNWNGDVSVTAPSGGYTAGLAYQIGSGGYAIARQTVAAGASCLVAFPVSGQSIVMTKAAGTGKTFAVGAKVYRDATNKNAVSGSTGNVLIGMCVKAAAATDTTVEITAYPIVTAT